MLHEEVKVRAPFFPPAGPSTVALGATDIPDVDEGASADIAAPGAATGIPIIEHKLMEGA